MAVVLEVLLVVTSILLIVFVLLHKGKAAVSRICSVVGNVVRGWIQRCRAQP